jgi:hypothetical protein
MKEIQYNKATLSIINELSSINPSILIEKDNDKIVIKSKTANKSVAYIFKAPIEEFEFEGDNCAFYNYTEFFKLFSVMDSPVIKQNVAELTMQKNRSTMKYRLSKPEIIPASFNGIKFDKSEVSIVLTSDYIKKLHTFVSSGMLGSDRIKLTGSGNELTITLENSKHAHSFSEVIELETEINEEFSFIISATIFATLPSNKDFKFSINPDGIVEFKYINDKNIELDIYTTLIIEDV